MTFAQNRKWLRRALRVGFAIIAGFAATSLFPALELLWQWLSPGGRLEPVELLTTIPVAGNLLSKGTEGVLALSPYFGSGLVGFFLGWFFLGRLSEWLVTRCLEPLDTRVLQPVRKPRPYDPLYGAVGTNGNDLTLPFILEEEGGRRKVWDTLIAFVDKDRHTCSPDSAPLFGWTLLMGRAGSGKSRMAVELSRHLAQRDTYGGDGRNRPSAVRRLGSWWRAQAMRRDRYPEDPWDAGWLRPGFNSSDGAYPKWRGRLSAALDDEWLENLRDWRPRRPTILLLDDPHIDETRRVVEILTAASKQYLSRVRLLVVNQTAISELGLVYEKDAWTLHGLRSPLIAPVSMPDEGKFNAADIRKLRGCVGLSKGYPLATDRLVDQFLEITAGSPLLVEIGLRLLHDGKLLVDFSEEDLVRDRVDRVVMGLEQAGLSAAAGHHRTVALATLVGGMRKDDVTETYSLPIDRVAELKRIFPVEAEDLRNVLPPIRPQAVGDAFVRRVVSELSDEARRRFVELAWRINLSGTLRAASRLVGRDDAIGSALAAGPPHGTGLMSIEVALSYAEFAIIVSSRMKAVYFDRSGHLLAQAEARLSSLSAEEGLAAFERLIGFAAPFGDGSVLRVDGWVRALAASLVGAASAKDPAPTLPATLLSDLWGHWYRLVGDGFLDRCVAEKLTSSWKGYVSNANLSWNAITSLIDEAARLYYEMPCHALAAAFAGGFIDQAEKYGLTNDSIAEDVVRTVASLSYLARSNPDECQTFSNIVDRCSRRAVCEIAHQRASAQAWSSMAYAARNVPSECALYADKVDTIAKLYLNDRNLQHARATAWNSMVFATMRDMGECQRHVHAVEGITRLWPDDSGMQFERAQAWSAIAFVTSNDPAQCERHVRMVDDIVKPWLDTYCILLELVRAWRIMAASAYNNADQCKHYVSLIESISASWPHHLGMQYERAVAWRVMTLLERDDLMRCERNAQTVDNIAAPWPSNRRMQYERVGAWRIAAFAGSGSLYNYERLTRMVEDVATPFPDDREIQFERALAWANLAFASRNDLVKCEHYVGKVDDIAATWPDDRGIQNQRARARRGIVFAYKEDPAECERHVRVIDLIAAPWPDDRDMQLQRAFAWRAMTYATTDHHAACERHALKVDTIVLPWSGDHDMQFERAAAWRNATLAAADDPAKCELYARTVEEVAVLWPNSRSMQLERALAWENLAITLRGDASERDSHLRTVITIAAQWPNDADFAGIVVRARSMTSDARRPA